MSRSRRRRRSKPDFVSLASVIAAFLFLEAMGRRPYFLETIVRWSLVGLAFVAVVFAAAWFFGKQRRNKLRAALLAAGASNAFQLTPEQYEQFCAALLVNNGWRTRMTRKSGDFGADVIATKEGRVLVIQCKQWSKSVGIKAVQEAHAALSHYRATQAAVVTTTDYTTAAKALAKSTGVRLLSHRDLVQM